jgi:hypothetical protein
LAPHLNETARFLQNDAVSYIQKKKRKKKEKNGVVLNDTVHLLPPITQRGRRKKGLLFFEFCRPLSPGAHRPDTMADHPPRTCQKTEEGGPSLGSRAQWPTGRLLPMLHNEKATPLAL